MVKLSLQGSLGRHLHTDLKVKSGLSWRLHDAGDARVVGNLQGKLLMEGGTGPRERSVLINKTEKS